MWLWHLNKVLSICIIVFFCQRVIRGATRDSGRASEIKVRNLIWWTGRCAIYLRWHSCWCHLDSLYNTVLMSPNNDETAVVHGCNPTFNFNYWFLPCWCLANSIFLCSIGFAVLFVCLMVQFFGATGHSGGKSVSSKYGIWCSRRANYNLFALAFVLASF